MNDTVADAGEFRKFELRQFFSDCLRCIRLLCEIARFFLNRIAGGIF